MDVHTFVFAWIRFDQVTLQFARPWMWSEPSCAPLLATGAEMGSLEEPWQYESNGGGGVEQVGQNVLQPMRARYDVPTFVRDVWTIVHTDGFEQLTEQHKVGRLFGLGSPAEALTRECSINMLAIRKHGTLEFRRFHGSLDATLIVRWAHFCVAFVECFRTRPWRLLSDELSMETALHTLQTAQEAATADELMACMDGYVDPTTAVHFARDACHE